MKPLGKRSIQTSSFLCSSSTIQNLFQRSGNAFLISAVGENLALARKRRRSTRCRKLGVGSVFPTEGTSDAASRPQIQRNTVFSARTEIIKTKAKVLHELKINSPWKCRHHLLRKDDSVGGERATVPLSLLLQNAVLTCVCTPWYLVFGSLDAIRIRRAKERIQPRETRR